MGRAAKPPAGFASCRPRAERASSLHAPTRPDSHRPPPSFLPFLPLPRVRDRGAGTTPPDGCRRLHAIRAPRAGLGEVPHHLRGDGDDAGRDALLQSHPHRERRERRVRDRPRVREAPAVRGSGRRGRARRGHPRRGQHAALHPGDPAAPGGRGRRREPRAHPQDVRGRGELLHARRHDRLLPRARDQAELGRAPGGLRTRRVELSRAGATGVRRAHRDQLLEHDASRGAGDAPRGPAARYERQRGRGHGGVECRAPTHRARAPGPGDRLLPPATRDARVRPLPRLHRVTRGHEHLPQHRPGGEHGHEPERAESRHG